MSHAFIVIAVVAIAVLLFDRNRHRRALRARDSWHCFKCGVQLNAGESVKIAVAGAGPSTLARVCQRCASKDRRVQLAAWLIIAAAFTGTIALVAIN